MRTIEQELQRLLHLRDENDQRVPCTLVTADKTFIGFVITELSPDYVIGMDPDQRANYATDGGARQVWFIKKTGITQIFVPGKED